MCFVCLDDNSYAENRRVCLNCTHIVITAHRCHRDGGKPVLKRVWSSIPG